MLEKISLEKVLFLDIETVPQFAVFDDLGDQAKLLFKSKNRFKFDSQFIDTDEEAEKWQVLYGQMGAIQSEFGKIVCISVGFVHQTRDGKEIRLKSFYHDDEETLLKQFKALLEDKFNTPHHILCGHNAKEFDIPYICRRMLINGIKLPSILNIAGKKPWEINHLDTMELWKFGDFKAYTSLSLLCHVFNIPTPKDDISGADVARVYYQNEKDIYTTGLERIKVYCEKDVVALIQLFLRFQHEDLVEDFAIHYSK